MFGKINPNSHSCKYKDLLFVIEAALYSWRRSSAVLPGPGCSSKIFAHCSSLSLSTPSLALGLFTHYSAAKLGVVPTSSSQCWLSRACFSNPQVRAIDRATSIMQESPGETGWLAWTDGAHLRGNGPTEPRIRTRWMPRGEAADTAPSRGHVLAPATVERAEELIQTGAEDLLLPEPPSSSQSGWSFPSVQIPLSPTASLATPSSRLLPGETHRTFYLAN